MRSEIWYKPSDSEIVKTQIRWAHAGSATRECIWHMIKIALMGREEIVGGLSKKQKKLISDLPPKGSIRRVVCARVFDVNLPEVATNTVK